MQDFTLDREALSGPHAFFGGLIHVLERISGHRSGTDAVLLAACLPEGAKGLVLDLGCGSGVVGLAVVARHPALRALLLDSDPALCALAALNAQDNGLSGRVQTLCADMLALQPVLKSSTAQAAGLVEEGADYVLSNPPFHPAGRVRVSPYPGKASAHVLEDEALAQWIKSAGRLLKPRGQLIMIHRPDAVPFLLQSMAGRFGAVRIKPVHGKAGRPATRVLIAGIKGSRAPFSLLEPLILHEPDGQRSAVDEAIARGRHLIDMGL